jgi:hypothetical protein
MRRIWSSLPSPALVVAVVALVAALAGSAVAASPLVTSSAKPVTKKKVKKIAKKVAKKQAKKAVNAFEEEKFPIGASDLAAIIERSESESIGPSPGGVITTETATADCQTGERVISGGWSTELQIAGATTDKAALIFEDQRSDNGWEASAGNLSSTETNELTAHAYCLAP